jgi:NarL family two-component system response regulator LiaR
MENPMSERNPIRLMLVDDHQMVRNGLKTFLMVHKDLELVGEAANGEQALSLLDRTRPDVVLMDLKMPGLDGIQTTRAMLARAPGVRVIALTSFKEQDMIQQALEAGVIGYLLKDIGCDDLADAIRAATRGQPALAPEAMQALFRAATRGPALGDDLTDRESQVLALMAEGSSNDAIAAHLVIGPSTVKSHVSSVLSKLGASSRTEAVSLALKHGIIR